MAKVVGDISVRVGADIGPLNRGMKNAGKSVDDFQARTKKMAVNVAKAGAAVVTAMAAVAGAVLAAAKEAAEAGTEIQNLANVAGTSTTNFQRMAAASATVGVEQGKLSDILKDVNDKFGDYMATGAGPLADFFENIAPKIGVTAEEFAKLSGPDALQLYVKSLEQAGVSQQQMTFYMEALASDTTALVPLLRNSGAEMKRFGDEAEAAGRILSDETIAAAVEMDRELTELSKTLKTQATTAILEYKEEILAAANFIVNDLIPAIGSLIGAAIDFAEGFKPALQALQNFVDLGRIVAGMDSSKMLPAVRDPAVAAEDQALANGMGGGDVSNTGVFGVDADGNIIEFGADGPSDVVPGITGPSVSSVPLVSPKASSGRSSGGGRGSRSRGPTADDLEALEAGYLSERELLDVHLASEMEKLEEYRNAKLASEGEFNELEVDIKARHLESIAEMERAAQQARLQAIGGAFGDLSALMASENKKLFKVGQAAALAEATVSGYQAAVSAWQKGMSVGGPPLAGAFAAASLAKTGFLISQIKGASSTGGGGGSTGSVSTTTTTQESASQSPLQVNLTGLGANDLLRGSDVSALLDRLSEEAGDRGLILAVEK